MAKATLPDTQRRRADGASARLGGVRHPMRGHTPEPDPPSIPPEVPPNRPPVEIPPISDPPAGPPPAPVRDPPASAPTVHRMPASAVLPWASRAHVLQQAKRRCDAPAPARQLL